MEVKRQQREKELIEEITTSTLMVNKAKALIALEAKQKEELKQYHKNYQDRVYQVRAALPLPLNTFLIGILLIIFQDNLIRLERKEREKQENFDLDR